ncbi:MAG: sigma-70 region 4 domain-containing protein [Clostridia bacterium]|nr:sigma-70 region 4 domain-containing protein [Clostridia bacterium]
MKIARIFYLHYVLGLTIKEISINLNEKESNIKNYLYRTLNELKTFIEKEGDNHDK